MRWLHSAWRLFGTIFIIQFCYAFTKYELPCNKQLLTESEKVALNEVGTMETSQNMGTVKKYLKSVGLNEGYPYCAAGVYWCFAQSVENLKYSKKDIPILKTASANNMLNNAIERGKSVKAEVMVNDLIVWKSKTGWNGHIERVIEVKGKGIVKTIGFNVKIDNGEGVGIKTRFLTHQLGRLLLRGIITFKEIEK